MARYVNVSPVFVASEKRYGRSRDTFHGNPLLLSSSLYMNLKLRPYTINQIFAIPLCRGRGKLHIVRFNTCSRICTRQFVIGKTRGFEKAGKRIDKLEGSSSTELALEL